MQSEYCDDMGSLLFLLLNTIDILYSIISLDNSGDMLLRISGGNLSRNGKNSVILQ